MLDQNSRRMCLQRRHVQGIIPQMAESRCGRLRFATLSLRDLWGQSLNCELFIDIQLSYLLTDLYEQSMAHRI